MDIFLQILFWLSIFLIFHSYVLFPLILKLKAENKTENSICYTSVDEFPKISILTASYNEEKNIEQKIITTFKTDYPLNKIEFLIGSDNSNDKTNEIIKKYTEKYPQIKFYPFRKRTGKINIINKLKTEAKNDILILTDSKVFFKENTLYHLIKHFKNHEIKIVGGILKNSKINKNDISKQEDAYMNREMLIKYREGIIWGASVGVFGAIYAIRKKDFPQIPSNFKADDFYVTMKILKNGGKVIFEKEALAEEQITGNIKEEYKRKVRIAAGNFQNLEKFISILKNPFTGKAFSFFSHKIIRWSGPFLILISFICNLLLISYNLYKISLIIFAISMIIPFIDFMLKKINIHINILRYFTHFYGMNFALLAGFFQYLKGTDSAIWEPSKR